MLGYMKDVGLWWRVSGQRQSRGNEAGHLDKGRQEESERITIIFLVNSQQQWQ